MKKHFLTFAAVASYVVGTLGGFGFAMYNQAYFIAICVAMLGVLAFPTVKKMFKDLLN